MTEIGDTTNIFTVNLFFLFFAFIRLIEQTVFMADILYWIFVNHNLITGESPLLRTQWFPTIFEHFSINFNAKFRFDAAQRFNFLSPWHRPLMVKFFKKKVKDNSFCEFCNGRCFELNQSFFLYSIQITICNHKIVLQTLIRETQAAVVAFNWISDD